MSDQVVTRKKVMVGGVVNEDKTYMRFSFKSESGYPLSAQDIIDVLGDYLLVDPDKLFIQPTKNH